MQSFPRGPQLAARRAWRLGAVALAGASLAACASVTPRYAVREPAAGPPVGGGQGYKTGAPYQVGGIWYFPHEQPDYDQTGVASWYGDAFNLRPTADGEIFDKDLPSAAHTTLPLPSLVEVTNLDNGRKLVVRVNDRGPFVGGRIIDLSHEAARRLGYDRAGLARVRVRYVGPAPLRGEETLRYARAQVPARAAPAPQAAPASTPLVKPPAPVMVAELKPLPAPIPAPPPAADAPPAAAPGGFKVQAGAFASAENAQRAADRLAAAGHAAVEPISRGGVTLWRVVLDGAADEDAAEALREKAAGIGFADARVIGP